eukprot:4074038-Prymnesium_polylepis.1
MSKRTPLDSTARHGSRACTIPTHALASPRPTAAHVRSDARSPPCSTTAPAIEARALHDYND